MGYRAYAITVEREDSSAAVYGFYNERDRDQWVAEFNRAVRKLAGPFSVSLTAEAIYCHGPVDAYAMLEDLEEECEA